MNRSEIQQFINSWLADNENEEILPSHVRELFTLINTHFYNKENEPIQNTGPGISSTDELAEGESVDRRYFTQGREQALYEAIDLAGGDPTEAIITQLDQNLQGEPAVGDKLWRMLSKLTRKSNRAQTRKYIVKNLSEFTEGNFAAYSITAIQRESTITQLQYRIGTGSFVTVSGSLANPVSIPANTPLTWRITGAGTFEITFTN